MTTVKAAVIGYPVAHSLSPLLHGFWLKNMGIDGQYEAVEIRPEEFNKRFVSLGKKEGFRGVNVTVPYKEKVLALVDEIDVVAKAIGAANTIVYRKNGSIYATNTDGWGFIENIRHGFPAIDWQHGSAVVLGAGGAARAVVTGLLEQKVPRVIISNRTQDKALAIQNDLSVLGLIDVVPWEARHRILREASILVNTTVLGMTGKSELSLELDHLPQTALVTDIVYTPLQTSLLKRAQQRGNPVIDGLGMLLYQAVQGFELWFGIKPQVTTALRQHIISRLQK